MDNSDLAQDWNSDLHHSLAVDCTHDSLELNCFQTLALQYDFDLAQDWSCGRRNLAADCFENFVRI